MPRLTFKGLSEDLLKGYDITLSKTTTAYKVEFPCGKVTTLSTLQAVIEGVSAYQAAKLEQQVPSDAIDAECEFPNEDIPAFGWSVVEPTPRLQLMKCEHDFYEYEERIAIQSQDETLAEGALDWDYELNTAYWQPLTSALTSNYILEMFLLVFDVKITTLVIEAYCKEISEQYNDKWEKFHPDWVGTKAMNLGNDADDLIAYVLELEDESFVGYAIYEVINASAKYIQPILSSIEFLELEPRTECFYWDTEKRTLVEA